MPVPGGSGGSDFREADIKRIREERDSVKDLIESQKALLEEQDKLLKSGTLNRTETAKLVKEIRENEKAIKANEEAVKNLSASLIPLLKARLAEQQAVGKLSAQYDVLSKKIAGAAKILGDYAGSIKTGIAAYHSYNLSVQHIIDSTGKYVGQSARARQEFDSFRRELNLTREAAIKFGDAWAEGRQLGLANDQLKKMVGNLQKVHGQTKGLEMARDIMAIPATRQTIQGVARQDPRAIAEAIRMGNMRQMQAVTSTLRRPEARDAQTQAAIRFERSVAKYETLTDDIKASIQGFAAAGLGPEAAALMGPVSDISKHVARIAENSTLMKQLFIHGMPKLASIPGMLGKIPAGMAKLSGPLSKIPLIGGRLSKIAAGGLDLSAGSLLKGGGLALAGELGGMALDWGAERLEKGGRTRGAKWARVGAATAKGAGMGAMLGSIIPGLGTGVGAGVGAAVGGAVGIAQQFGDTIVTYAGRFGTQMSKYAAIAGTYITDSAKGFFKNVDQATGGLVTALTDAANYIAGKVAEAAGVVWKKITDAAGVAKEKLFGKDEEQEADIGAIVNAQGTLIKKIQESLGRLGPTIDSLPESIRAAIATRAGEVGVGTVGREGVEEARGAFVTQITTGLDRMAEDLNARREEIVVERDTNLKTAMDTLAKARARGAGDEEIRAIESGIETIKINAQEGLNSIEQTAQEVIQKIGIGRGAEVEMRRLETRRGQVGLEREAAAGRFKATAAVTGDVEEINRYREAVNKGYAEESQLLDEARAAVKNEWDIQDQIVMNRIAANQGNEEMVRQLQIELRNNQRQRADAERNLNNQEELLKISTREAQIAVERSKATAYELTLAYREAKAQQDLVGIREAAARARGITPEEAGGFARGRLDATRRQLAELDKTFSSDIARWRAEIAQPETTESKRMELEQLILDHTIRRATLEGKITEEAMKAATVQEEERQKQLGLQSRLLEIQRDSASRVGMSWRVQMGFQTDIIRLKREEAASAKRELEMAIAGGAKADVVLQKQINVAEKDAALREAIMGKQRDFLEKAVAQSFGMGGGSKALPNINPRIFGEIVKDRFGGMWQGLPPRTIEENRAAMGGNLRGGIPGGGGIGVGGGGINAAPGRPGAVPAAPGVPGGVGPVAIGPGGNKGGVDVSGNFNLMVKADTDMFRFEVEKVVRAEFKSATSTGAIG